MARRIKAPDAEISALPSRITELVEAVAPALLGEHGARAGSAAVLLVTAGDNPGRLRGEAAFAALCGVSRPRARRSAREPCLLTRPRAAFRPGSRCRGVSPAQEHRYAANLNRVTSPASATMTAASTGPMPGSCWITW